MSEKQLAFSTSDTANKTLKISDTVTITATAAGTKYTKVGTFLRAFNVTPDVLGCNIEAGFCAPCNVHVSATGYTISIVTVTGSGFVDGTVATVSVTFKGPLA